MLAKRGKAEPEQSWQRFWTRFRTIHVRLRCFIVIVLLAAAFFMQIYSMAARTVSIRIARMRLIRGNLGNPLFAQSSFLSRGQISANGNTSGYSTEIDHIAEQSGSRSNKISH